MTPLAVVRLAGWHTLPIRPNLRMHWAQKAKITKAIRHAAYVEAQRVWGRRKPIDYPVVATLVWQVVDRRVRDAGAGCLVAKAAIDGCVDARLLARDSHDVVAMEQYRVEVGPVAGIRLEIARVAA